jgi:hypothetical protein
MKPHHGANDMSCGKVPEFDAKARGRQHLKNPQNFKIRYTAFALCLEAQSVSAKLKFFILNLR